MRAGDRRHEIIIRQETSTQNSYGEPVEAWADLATVRASVTPISSREAFYAQSERGSAVYEFRFINSAEVAGIDEACRIIWKGKTFDLNPPLLVDRERVVLIRGTVRT